MSNRIKVQNNVLRINAFFSHLRSEKQVNRKRLGKYVYHELKD